MIQRKTIPYNGFEIAVATERMREGKWAVVVNLKQSTGNALRNVDLPVSHQRFDSQVEAEDYGVRTATEWIEENTPKAAGRTYGGRSGRPAGRGSAPTGKPHKPAGQAAPSSWRPSTRFMN